MGRILQPNETGYGILVEYDAGFLDKGLNQYNKFLSESFNVKEGEPVLITCILQKWGVKNQNGRIYPKDVLVSQVNEYMKLVDLKSSVSESDHPECVSVSNSMICTKDGWKCFEEIAEDEEVLTLNVKTNKIEIQKIDKKIYQPYKGTMYSFKSNNVGLTVTPNHRFLLEDSKGVRFYETAENIYNDVNGVMSKGRNKILKLGDWVGEDYEYFTLNGVDESLIDKKQKKVLKEVYCSSVNINAEDWFSFLGIYFSDGHCSGAKTEQYKSRGYDVVITQKKEKQKAMIEELLNRLPFSLNKINFPDGKVQYHLADARLYNYLYPYGYSLNKHIPLEIKNASPRLLNKFIEWFVIGDGRDLKYKNKKSPARKSVFSTSKQMIYDLQEMLIKSGQNGNVTKQTEFSDRKIIDRKYKKEHSIDEFGKEVIIESHVDVERIIKKENLSTLYNLNISKSKHIYLDKRTLKIEKIDYDDYVGCVSVPNENFLVSVDGKSHWTGNSSIISLLNISHLITKMWWGTGDKENVLYGQIKLIVTPGFIKYGIASVVGDKILLYLQNEIKIGISSRGVGSLKEIKGENIVQDDFELIGFDLVSTPSTPGAYLFPGSSGESMGMGESYKNKNGVLIKEENKILTTLDRFLL